jgi:hypothetical protein
MTMPPPPPAPPSPGHLPVPAAPADISYGDVELDNVAGPADPLPPNLALDTIVDAVVQRIERRVVDELERRGRWQGWGVH